jgi:hypothetical protein
MGLETGTYIDSLVTTNPPGTDDRSTADDHLRLLKSTIKNTFPNVTGAVTPTHTELNFVDGVTSAIQTQLNLKAPIATPSFTGTLSCNGGSWNTGGIDLASGDQYEINGVVVLNATSLGSGVLSSSLTSLGTIASLVATTADINNGTVEAVIGGTTPKAGSFTTLSASAGITGDLTGDVTGDVTGNADTATTAANVTTNANLTGHITSTGNATVLGTFSSGQLRAALSDETGSGAAVFAQSPVLTTPNLGTPSSLIGTNITGTAAGLSIGGNAATVSTNANLTGEITSAGNATTLQSSAITNRTAITSGIAGGNQLLLNDSGTLKELALNNLIPGQASALTSGLAAADELLISDAGSVKKMAVSVIRDYIHGALALTGPITSSGEATTIAVGGISASNMFASGVVDQTALGVDSVGQSETKTAGQGVSGTQFFTATGGIYIIGSQQDRNASGDQTLSRKTNGAGANANNTTEWHWQMASSGTYDDCTLYYIPASPPYDLGDGEIPYFVYITVDNATSDVLQINAAPDPVWVYNGPTNATPSRYDSDGKAYRTRRDMSQMPMTYAQAKAAGPVAVKDYSQAFKAAPIIEEEITQAIKNADMDVLPTPWTSWSPAEVAGKTIVLLDPVAPLMADLLGMVDYDTPEVMNIIKNYIQIGNIPLNRAGPKDLMIVSARWK